MAGLWDDKVVLLGITGSIAAYKACDIASRLCEAGAAVIPALTRSARQFLGATGIEAITGHRCVTEMFAPAEDPEIEHIALARRAHLFLIAPATANIIAKAAHGIADDWLSTTLLATRAPVLFAPAMNTMMYEHPATQANIETLRGRGYRFVGPEAGSLACGEVGHGRLIATSAILEAGEVLISKQKDLAGKHVLITSGATHEPIDPVRFISNRSSGKMGRAIALEALRRGAKVTVIGGPAETPLPHAAELVAVQTAAEMLEAVAERFDTADIFIAVAAVADYRVPDPTAQKRKRKDQDLVLTLRPTSDIAAYAGQNKAAHQVCVGFAAETNDPIENAVARLKKKNLDLIVVNQVGVSDSGFGSDTSRACILGASESPSAADAALHLRTKEEIAQLLFDRIIALG